MTNKLFRIILPVVWFLWAPFAHAETKLKIGFIGSMTGSAAAYGISARNGVDLALEEIAPEKRPEVLFEDDQFVPNKTVTAFQKLRAQGADVIISIGSTPSAAISPFAKTLRAVE